MKAHALINYIKDGLSKYSESTFSPKVNCSICHNYRYRAVMFIVEPLRFNELCKSCAEEMLQNIKNIEGIDDH